MRRKLEHLARGEWEAGVEDDVTVENHEK
jgi:hypothetical protein